MQWRFDPAKRGLKAVLGDLEFEIMDYIWDHDEVAVREVHRAIGPPRDLAYTTVMTVTNRLFEKGLLRRREEGRAYIYRAVQTRAQFSKDVASRLMKSVWRDFSEPAMSFFMDELSDADLAKLDTLSRKAKRQRKKE